MILAVDGDGSTCRVALDHAGSRHVVSLGAANVTSDFDGAVARITEGLRSAGLTYEPRGPCEDCKLEADLIRSWSQLFLDEGNMVAEWLWDGAPAGIASEPELKGLWPLRSETAVDLSPEELFGILNGK